MSPLTLPDTQWSKIVNFLNICSDIYIGQETDLKQFIQAVLWITRSGSQWRIGTVSINDLQGGVIKGAFNGCTHTLPMIQIWSGSSLIPPSFVLPLCRGCFKSQGPYRDQGWILNQDSCRLGNPLRFRLSTGQQHDITCAEALIDGYSSEYVIADTSYDAMAFIESITCIGAGPVIPPRANRRNSRTYDVHLY